MAKLFNAGSIPVIPTSLEIGSFFIIIPLYVEINPTDVDRYRRYGSGEAATIGGVAADCKSVPKW